MISSTEIIVEFLMLKEEFGIKLKESRKAQKMSQKQVADRLGVAQPVYQRFEAGIYECNYEQLKTLCDIFDVSADFLLGRTDF